MFQPLRTGLVILSAATLLTACGEPEDTRPGQPVKQRQTAFKDIIKSFEPMGVMLRKGTYDAERVEKFTAELIARRDLPWGHCGSPIIAGGRGLPADQGDAGGVEQAGRVRAGEAGLHRRHRQVAGGRTEQGQGAGRYGLRGGAR